MSDKNGFLVLTRFLNQALVIDGSITVYVSKIENDFACLAIQASKSVKILRKEVYDKMNSPRIDHDQ